MVETVMNEGLTHFVLTRRSGEKVLMNWEEARAIYIAMDHEYYLEDLKDRIVSSRNDGGTYCIGNNSEVELTDDEIKTLAEMALETYVSGLSECDNWTSIIDHSLKKAFEEMKGSGV